ncbi:Small subunit (SSU) processome component [Cryptotrichosporon argae]
MAPKQPVAGPSRQKVVALPPPPPPAVSAFNAARTRFALSLPILGSAERVQIWDTAADRVIAEWEVEGAAGVSALCFATVPLSGSGAGKKKRRKQRGPGNGGDDEEVVLVATDKADVAVLNLKGEIVRKFPLPGKATAAWSDDVGTIFATAAAVVLVSPDALAISQTWPVATPPTAVALLPTSTSDDLHILVGSSAVSVLHASPASPTPSYTSSPLPVSTTSVTSLHPLPQTQHGASFLVVSADDRTVSQYTIATPGTAPKLSYRYASPTLSPAHSIASSTTLAGVLHASGEISLFALPSDLDYARPKSDSKPSTLKLVEGKDEKVARLARIAFVADDDAGALWAGRMAGGGRVRWHRASYELPEGGLRASTVVKVDAQDLVAATSAAQAPLQRYVAPAAVAVDDASDDESPAALPTEVDLADLSLGERLLALPTAQPSGPAAAAAAVPALEGPATAASLTRLLVQALHTSDPALLTLCLSHRDPTLIRNTVRKMPAQLALPLLRACVERLGQGKGVNRRGGGAGSVQNEQQGRGTVEWVKGVLIERGALLMTMPSLPAQLAALSRLLATRMELHQPLLALSGRLDLALAQIAARRAAASKGPEDEGAARYVEGESDDEVEVEHGDEGEGEVEDVDMMGGDSEDEDEDDEDSEDDDEDEDDGALDSDDDELLDVDAEESSDEESDEDSE